MRNVERAKQIATEKGINVSFVCREIGKSRGYISQMLVSGRDLPDDMIEPVAKALGVSVSYLTGQTDDPAPEQKEKPTVTNDDGLSIQWADVEAAFKAATPEMREAAKAAALAVLSSQNK